MKNFITIIFLFFGCINFAAASTKVINQSQFPVWINYMYCHDSECSGSKYTIPAKQSGGNDKVIPTIPTDTLKILWAFETDSNNKVVARMEKVCAVSGKTETVHLYDNETPYITCYPD